MTVCRAWTMHLLVLFCGFVGICWGGGFFLLCGRAPPALPRSKGSCLQFSYAVGVPVRHAQLQHTAELYSAVRALQSWGLGKLPCF